MASIKANKTNLFGMWEFDFNYTLNWIIKLDNYNSMELKNFN